VGTALLCAAGQDVHLARAFAQCAP